MIKMRGKFGTQRVQVSTALLLFAFTGPKSADGSNGMSGGNPRPRSAVAHGLQNYSFRSSTPGSFQMEGDRSTYGFGDASFALEVESTQFPTCRGTLLQYKVVCDSSANDGRVGKFVVFWGEVAFWVEVKSTLLSPAQKEAILESILLSFNYNIPGKEN